MEEMIEKQAKISASLQQKNTKLKSDMSEMASIIELYEGLLDKLTEQNKKLKDWVRYKKRQEK